MVFSGDIPVHRADTEGRREGEIRELILLGDAPDQVLRRVHVPDPLPEEAVQYRTARILRLELVLQFEWGPAGNNSKVGLH